MKVFWIIAAVIVIAVLIWGFLTGWGKKGIYSTSSPSPVNTSSSTPISGEAAVSAKNFAFNPSQITITSGTKVIWTNNDSTAHTITSDDGKFTSSGQIQPGQTYEFTFSTPGTFAYHCSIHTTMKAQVIVE